MRPSWPPPSTPMTDERGRPPLLQPGMQKTVEADTNRQPGAWLGSMCSRGVLRDSVRDHATHFTLVVASGAELGKTGRMTVAPAWVLHIRLDSHDVWVRLHVLLLALPHLPIKPCLAFMAPGTWMCQ
jgi:hypothetical protein